MPCWASALVLKLVLKHAQTTIATTMANKTDEVFLRWTMSLPSLMDESTARCYRTGYTCCGVLAPNPALFRDFECEIAPGPRQMPPILGEIVARYRRLKVPHRSFWPRLLARTHDIPQKTHDRPGRSLVHLLAHRNSARTHLGRERGVHGRGVRH